MLKLRRAINSKFSIPGSRESGITSIVVVFVLIVLLSLIGIGFTKVMNRSLQSSASNQQATAANYAAQSGVNDALSYLKTQPSAAATKCDDLIKTGAPLAGSALLSSDGRWLGL
jgi:Tfp pilus assembly protein PilX